MKAKVTIILMLLTLSVFGQGYTASNGITYNVGDTITLNQGSALDGDFQFVQIGGIQAAAMYDETKGKDQFNVNALYSDTKLVIKRIKTYKVAGQVKYYFVMQLGFYLYIDDAIKHGEIK